MALDRISLAKTIDNASASVEQDQITRMCIGEYVARSDCTYVHRRVWSKIRLHVCASESVEQDQITRMCIG